MAVTRPSIEVIFKQYAGTFIERSKRGIAILIVKDDTDKSFNLKTYTNSAAVDLDKIKFTNENIKYIKDVLTFPVNKCVVVRVNKKDGLIIDALNIVERNIKTGWITIANGTPEDFENLSSWIKAKEQLRKTYKAIVYKLSVTDCKHLVNFYNDKVTFSDIRGEATGEKYCPSLIGILASCNVKQGSTNYKCGNLTRVEEVANTDIAISSGKFVLFNDDDDVKIVIGINSMTTTDGINNTEDMKYIDVIEAMDLIADDISRVFKDEYMGKYKNNYDNQILFISSINTYFKSLSNEYILDNNYDNKVNVDDEAQREAFIGIGKAEAENWDAQTIKNNSFKRTVFLYGDIKILGAMENLKFTITLF